VRINCLGVQHHVGRCGKAAEKRYEPAGQICL
jgi:hypothetical protein